MNRNSSRIQSLLIATLLVTAVPLAGCIGDDTTDDTPLGTDSHDVDPDGDGDGTVTLEKTFGGYLVYRASTGVLPEAQYEGDPPGFCFTTPANTTHLRGELAWDPPQPMMLKLSGPNGSYANSWDRTQPHTGLTNVTSPIILHVNDVEPGVWYTYAGPWAAGGAANWELTLTWTVERSDATLNETVYDGEPCGY